MSKMDMAKIRKDFPILKEKMNGKSLVYLDNTATSQKPKSVIQSLANYYQKFNANIHRGIYTLSEKATIEFEKTREEVAKFIHAKNSQEIIFTKNCTESINMVAYTWGEKFIQENDEIIVSALEHHSNLVPWQELCKRKKAKLKVIPLAAEYTLDLNAYQKLLSKNTKLVAISGMSNVIGTIPPLEKIIFQAHQFGAKVLVDSAQSIGHIPTDVQKIDCDFMAFSAHKMLGPTGVGVLYAKKSLLNEMPPFLFGGSMIKTVTQFRAEYAESPAKFEAGTPNIADVIAFREALIYLQKIGLKNIQKHDEKIIKYCKKVFSRYPEVTLYSPKKNFGGVLSFSVKNVHPHDIAEIFNSEGVCIRSGQHCAEPLIHALGAIAVARLSVYFYNDEKDIDRAEKALQKVFKIFKIK